MNRRLLLCIAACSLVAAFGCERHPPASAPTLQSNAFADATITDLGKQRWARTCGMCHVRGEGGAPKIGDVAAWQPRLEQGETIVLDHAINGFGNMPPLGYCMDCERDDLRAYIRFMATGGA